MEERCERWNYGWVVPVGSKKKAVRCCLLFRHQFAFPPQGHG